MLKTIVATLQTVMGSSLSQQSAVETVSQWQSQPPHVLIFDSGRREISQFMDAVDRLLQSPPPPPRNNSTTSNNNELIIPIAMARLKREFIAVLSRQADYHAGPISTITTADYSTVTDSTAYAFRYEDYVISDPPSSDVIIYLKNIAQRMTAAGKLADCIRAYKSVRRTFLQAQLSRLRFEELSVNLNAKRYLWDELKLKMEFWVQISKICVKKLFDREKKLCDQIFEGIIGVNNTSAKDECFVQTVQDFAVGLFSFAESMSLSNQPYERMETVFNVYGSFLSILPDVKALFDSVPGNEIINRCEETLSNIEIEVTRMLHDFENAVLHEKTVSYSSNDKGSVHQRTVYVMDKITLIAKNKNLLTNLIKSTPSLTFGDSIIPQEALGDDIANRSFLDMHLILIIVVLEQNLQNKADSYPNPTLGHLFMMNNLRYVLVKIGESSELKLMIGDSFMKLLNEDFELAMNSYKALTCDKFLNCFKDEGLYIPCCFVSRTSKSAVRERIKAFNGVFEEIEVVQCDWTIPDLGLRDEVRISMSEKLVPEYEKFLERFGSDPKMKLVLEKYVQYSVEDLEALFLQKLLADTQVIGA